MQIKFFVKKILVFFAIILNISMVFAEMSADVRSRLEEGFKAPSYNTNFPSEQLFSIADMKRKTYAVRGSKSLRLTRAGIYDPATEALGSPMFQILASTVIIDLNGCILTKNTASSEIRCVGVEVGYSPAMIAADTTLSIDSQPQNVIIRNGTLDNFDIGVVIHEGVKSVRFENVSFSRTPIGIVCMGDSTSPAHQIVSCSFDDVRIIGDYIDESGSNPAALEWARAKVETAHSNSAGDNGLGFNYGANTFMNVVNPVDGSDASVYCGMVMRYCNNMEINKLFIDGIGYRGGEVNSTVTYGLDVANSNNLYFDGLNVSSCISPAQVIGAHLSSCTSVSMKNSVFSNNVAQYVAIATSAGTNYRRAIGLHLESVSTTLMENIVCNANQANNDSDVAARARTYGLLWDGGVALDLKNISCDHNDAHGGFCYGMQFNSVESVSMDEVSADYNHGDGGDSSAGDDATSSNNMGTTGIYFSTTAKVIELSNVTANSNYGSSVVGLRMFAGEGVSVSNFTSNYSHGTAFIKGMSFGGSIKSCQLQDVSLVSNTSSGGVVNAATFAAAQSVAMSNMIFNYNTTSGSNQNVIALQFTGSAKTLVLNNIQVSSNAAHGNGVIKALEVTAGQDISLNRLQANSNTGGGASNIIDFITSIQTLTLKDVWINSNVITHATNGLTALSLVAPLSVSMDNVSIGSNSTSAAGAMQGIVMSTSASSVTMNDISINGNSSGTGNVRGIIATSPVALTLKNSSVSDNKHSGTGDSSTVRAIDFQTSASSVSLENVVVSATTATGSGIPVHGIYVATPVDLSLINVNCDKTTAAGAAVGIELGNGASTKSVMMKDVTVNYTNSSGSSAQGVVMTNAENISMQGVISNHATAEAASNAYGLNVSGYAKSFVLSDSTFNSNSGGDVRGIYMDDAENIKLNSVATDQNTGTDYVAGMQFDGSASDIAMKHISCNNNSSTGNDVNGIYIEDGVAIFIDGAFINNNSTSAGEAVGLYLYDDADTITLKNMSIDNISTSAESYDAYGMYIEDASNVSMENISTNHIASTFGTSGSNAYGIYFDNDALSVDMTNVTMNGCVGYDVCGLFLEDGENIFMQNVFADQNRAEGSVYGMRFDDSLRSLDAKNITANANTALDGTAYGFRFDDAVSVKMDGASADYNQASGVDNRVVGMYFYTDDIDNSSSISLSNVSASNNISDGGNATGILLQDGLAVAMDGVVANYNLSADDKIARGIHFDRSLQSAHLYNLTADSNYADSPTADMVAIGIHVEDPTSVEINNVYASRNLGGSRSYGLFIDGQDDGGSNVSIVGGILNGNDSSETSTTMAAVDTSATVSKHLPVNVFDSISDFENVLEGAFGLYIYDVNSCIVDNVDASRNSGVRAGGIYVAGCDDCTIQNSKTSFQQATGSYFFSADPFNGLTNTAITIPANQKATLFGGTSDTSVNLLELTKDLLHGMRNIKYLQDTSNYDPTLASVYADVRELSGAQMLMNAIMAQFRAFSTAVGVQIHNSENCLVVDHVALGNKSAKDSAIGIGISGTAVGHTVLRVKSASNESWTDSEITGTGSINIDETLPFWTFLETYVITGTWAGEALNGDQTLTSRLAAISSPITAAQIGFRSTESYHETYDILAADQPEPVAPLLSEPTIALDRLAISIFTDIGAVPANNVEEFVNCVGGTAVGILVGDAAENIVVDSCDCSNNNGNAGQFFGILQDVTTSMLAKDNRLYQASTNNLGYGFGIAELTLQSNSVHIGNVLFGNSIGDMLNSNYFIPFDPEDYPNIFFPVKIGYNGDIGNFANASPFDNLVIEFIAPKQTLPYIPNNMLTYWNDSSGSKSDWIS